MEQEKRGFAQAAMHYGTLLGILWIISFAVYVASLSIPELSLLFLILFIISPIYAGFLGIRYRKQECENKLSFLNSWAFMIITYLCASMLSAIACYIYFYYLDNGAMISAFKEQIEIYLAMDLGEEMEQAMNNTYEILSQLTASDITIQYFTSNVFIASLLAPITSLFVFKK